MQTLVPVNTMPQLLTPIKEVVSAPQFVQIERLVRGLLLVEGKRTLEAIRRALAEHASVKAALITFWPIGPGPTLT